MANPLNQLAFPQVAFFRLYRTAPTIDSTVANISTALLPLAGVLHLLVSMWMLSNRNIFEQVRANTAVRRLQEPAPSTR